MTRSDSNHRWHAVLVAALLSIAASMALSGCDRQEGPLEEAGERADEAIDEARDRAEEAEEQLRDAVEQAREEIEEQD